MGGEGFVPFLSLTPSNSIIIITRQNGNEKHQDFAQVLGDPYYLATIFARAPPGANRLGK